MGFLDSRTISHLKKRAPPYHQVGRPVDEVEQDGMDMPLSGPGDGFSRVWMFGLERVCVWKSV